VRRPQIPNDSESIESPFENRKDGSASTVPTRDGGGTPGHQFTSLPRIAL
jgi:hypothetical protein